MDRKRILVVDDSIMMRKFLAHLLGNDYEVFTIEVGIDALEWLYTEDKPDLILLDLNLPDISGWDLLDKFKKNDELKDIPVIILSGKDKSQDRIISLQKGALDYIIKPFNPEELKLRIQHVLLLSANVSAASNS